MKGLNGRTKGHDFEQRVQLRIISYEVTGSPKGIRDEDGYLLFFPALTFYTGQQNRYKKELRAQKKLAKAILKMLKSL